MHRSCVVGWVIALLLPLAARSEPPLGASIATRASISIEQPNILPTQAMGLGNGTLGAAFWAAQGLTIQLNRADTVLRKNSIQGFRLDLAIRCCGMIVV
jgi:alpha-L-fucosidase 2